jgi:hypothetical protein
MGHPHRQRRAPLDFALVADDRFARATHQASGRQLGLQGLGQLVELRLVMKRGKGDRQVRCGAQLVLRPAACIAGRFDRVGQLRQHGTSAGNSVL